MSLFRKGKGIAIQEKQTVASCGRVCCGFGWAASVGREHRERGVQLESVKAKSKQRPALKNFPSR